MFASEYAKWAKHYDPQNKEMECLRKNGICFHGASVLEIGCGTGRFTERIADNCESITCVDPDEEATIYLRSSISNPQIQVFAGTLESIELSPSTYDYIVFSWSFYQIPNQQKVLSLARRYLKPEGKVVVIQAFSGEYEETIACLYRHYKSIDAYKQACLTLMKLLNDMFVNVTVDDIDSFFEFDSVEQVVDCSLFFVLEEEGALPLDADIEKVKQRLLSYRNSSGKIILSDKALLMIAEKS